MSDLIERHIRALTEIARMPNAEHVADAHNEAVRYLREHAAALRAEREARIAAEQRAERLANTLRQIRTDLIAHDVLTEWVDVIDAEAS